MAWLISVLGAALAVAGAVSLWNGVSYIRLDWGQTETVAGTVAASAGVVTIALGAVLFALRDLARRAVQMSGAGMADRGELRSGIGRPAPTPAETPLPVPVVAAPVSLSPVGPSMGSDVAHLDEAADDPLPPMEEPAETHPVATAEAPTVVGRYEANGASYVLFSDGTIEVETESGTHRFASMSDLKDHIEHQDTR